MAKTTTLKRKPKWARYVLLGLGGLGFFHILSGPSGAINLFKLRQANTEMRDELDSLVERKRQLEIEKTRLVSDSAYLEQLARKELGMARPGEKVFRYMVSKKDK
ncbi:MAG TPA: septum formation initiator family protein [Fibrobacteria bacterium]|nr:septum formation initiator family protein [Fibrobacteria bacterium]